MKAIKELKYLHKDLIKAVNEKDYKIADINSTYTDSKNDFKVTIYFISNKQ